MMKEKTISNVTSVCVVTFCPVYVNSFEFVLKSILISFKTNIGKMKVRNIINRANKIKFTDSNFLILLYIINTLFFTYRQLIHNIHLL